MLTITKERVQTNYRNVLFIDHNENIPNEVLEAISFQEKGITITRNNRVDINTVSEMDDIFFFVESYNRKTVQELTEIQESINKKNTSIILVHRSGLAGDLFQYLSHEVGGIVSLSYLRRNFSLVLQSMKEKGVFLEASHHRDLVLQIEKKRMRDKPIKKLVLKREAVMSVLTKNEQDVLQFILDGHNNREIAELLFLAPSTISTIISHLLRKMQANDRTAAMVTAIRNGWVEAHR
ncbi:MULTISPECIES: response regulator transcription factor [Bacillaceae]|uniref:LuxR C-terminal-related transcriptional regulator n=1 Tax=Evansella alkalicola TaxID=745819 RepID=A0ABS6JVK9_9BACI|nr:MULTISPECIES: LuxR C-terminal-related transcriptional regulator [Bacillaceae]MBU9721724.1 LuxR C-terminal-related transcriptional regulator [Bacillus alkalicola]